MFASIINGFMNYNLFGKGAGFCHIHHQAGFMNVLSFCEPDRFGGMKILSLKVLLMKMNLSGLKQITDIHLTGFCRTVGVKYFSSESSVLFISTIPAFHCKLPISFITLIIFYPAAGFPLQSGLDKIVSSFEEAL